MSLLDDFDDAIEWGSNDDRLLGPDEPVDWFPPGQPAESPDSASPSMTTTE